MNNLAIRIRRAIDFGANEQILELLFKERYSDLCEILSFHYSEKWQNILHKKAKENSNYELLSHKTALDYITFATFKGKQILYLNTIPYNFFIMFIRNSKLCNCNIANQEEKNGRFITFESNDKVIVSSNEDGVYSLDLLEQGSSGEFEYSNDYSKIPEKLWFEFISRTKKELNITLSKNSYIM